MSLKPSVIEAVPEETARIARAAFPKGNLYLSLRDELGVLFADSDFADLFPRRGQPALAPWRLALITIMQFSENLSDRQAAEAVRSRIDWKYLLGLELADCGFDYSVLSGFRRRLAESEQQSRLLDRLLELLKDRKLLKARGRQRTDSTHVLAAIRVMNRLERVIETMRAALNQLAVEAPDWLAEVSSPEWFARYAHRAEQSRLPKQLKERTALAAQVGRDGFELLSLLDRQKPELLQLERVETLKQVWQQHYTRAEDGEARWHTGKEMTRAADEIESPYDVQARYSRKDATEWTGYKVHLSETCDESLPHLITNVHTTAATAQDVACTAEIQAVLERKRLAPSRHLVDAGYIDADLIVESQTKYGIELFGPTRRNPSWQARERGFDLTRFEIDWNRRQVSCPAGKRSVYWYEHEPKERYRRSIVKVRFDRRDCSQCEHRAECVRSRNGTPRQSVLPTKALHEALSKTRTLLSSEEGKREYQKRAGIEGTLSQGIRRGSLRRGRYIGLAKIHLQEVATAVAINILRTVNFLHQKPTAKTRVSRFAKLAY